MEDVVLAIIKVLASAIRWILWEILIQIVIFNLGRGVLLGITLGRYPRGKDLENDFNVVLLSGVGALVCLWVAVAFINNS